MDFAGDTATKRGIDLARSKGFDLKVVKLPEGKDPDNVISKNPEDFKKMVDSALSIVEFYFQDALSKFDKKTPEGKREISKLLLPVIKKVLSRIEQSSWVQRLAKELMVKEEYIEEELKKTKNDQPFNREVVDTNTQTSIPQKTRKDLLEESLIALLLKNPKNFGLIDKESLVCFSSKSQEALNHLADRENISPELGSFFAYLGIKADLEKIEEKEIVPEIKFCLKGIKSLNVKNEMDEISLQIKGAEAEKNFEKIKSLTEQFNALSKKINQ
jgi:DNA primase